MPEPLKSIFELLGKGTPIWLFVAVVALNFYFVHIRQIIKDRQVRNDSRLQSEYKNKESIVTLVASAKDAVREINKYHDRAVNDVITLVHNRRLDGGDAEEFASSYTGDLDAAMMRLNSLTGQIDDLNIFDGTHDNLLKAKALVSRIQEIRSIAIDAQVSANTAVHELMDGGV